MPDKLHIVCLDAPAPPDYGGAIDMYYKIKALADLGLKITLHYFDYKNGRNADSLHACCNEVFAYKRKTFLQAPTFLKPHIVVSRINPDLIRRLNADDNAVLLEGIHCTGILPFLKNQKRNTVVRLHNDEAAYYQHLANTERNIFKKTYYSLESRLLKRYQKNLPINVAYAAISKSDVQTFRTAYGLNNVFHLPAFLPWQKIISKPGKGNDCLYHGNLTVVENKATVLWLIEQVFSKITVPLRIAGKGITTKIKKAAAPFPHIQFFHDPTESKLAELIANAHIHVLPDFNKTGVKLKLLHALFCGRFCITNNNALPLNNTFVLAQTSAAYIEWIGLFMAREFTITDIEQRADLLREYNNQENAQLISAHLL